jgi:small subunit ribosomal protein S4
VNVPSYKLKPGDVLRVRAASSQDGVIELALDASKVRTVPSWLSFNEEERSGKILSLPDRHEMESGVEEHLIVEFYSR